MGGGSFPASRGAHSHNPSASRAFELQQMRQTNGGFPGGAGQQKAGSAFEGARDNFSFQSAMAATNYGKLFARQSSPSGSGPSALPAPASVLTATHQNFKMHVAQQNARNRSRKRQQAQPSHARPGLVGIPMVSQIRPQRGPETHVIIGGYKKSVDDELPQPAAHRRGVSLGATQPMNQTFYNAGNGSKPRGYARKNLD